MECIRRKNLSLFMGYFCSIFLSLICLVGSVFASPPPVRDTSGSALGLTEEEELWLEKHPVILLGAMEAWPPFNFVDQRGNPSGIGSDLVRALNKRLGGRLRIVPGIWDDLYERVCRKELDGLLDITPKPEREEYFNFTTPYLSVPHVIIAPKGVPLLRNEDDLAEKVLALEQGFGNVNYFRERYPRVRIREYRDTPQALEAVARGEADAYAGNRGVALFLIEKNVMTNLRVHGGLRKEGSILAVGVRKDWPLFHAILQKALEDITPLEVRQIRSRWVTPVGEDSLLSSVSLTGEDYQWLEDHPVIRVGIMDAWPPMNFVDATGTPRGIGMDFVEALNKRLEGRLQVLPGPWEQIYARGQKRELDVLMDITPLESRNPFFNFTMPYATIPHVMVAPKKGPYFHALSDLLGKKVAVEQGFFVAAHIREHYPDIQVVEYASTSDALDAVNKGEADAYVGNRAVAAYLIQKELLSNLQIQGKLRETASVNSMGVRKDWPELAAILDKILGALPPEEVDAIYRKWGGAPADLILSPKDQAWLEEHPVILAGITSHVGPLEFLDENGAFRGIAADYLEYMGDLLGVTFQCEVFDSWKEKMEQLSQGAIQICPVVGEALREQDSFLRTQPYLSLPMVIFNRRESPYVSDLEELSGKKVAVIPGRGVTDYIRKSYPLLNLLEVGSVSEALRALQRKRVDAYIGSILITTHYIRQEGFTNLKVAGQTSFVEDISMGVRGDLPMLAELLQKALDTLSPEERQEISRQWMSVTYWRIDYALIWKILFIATLLLGLFLYWNRRLAAEIEERRRAERALQQAKEIAEVATRAKSDFLANMSHEIRTPMNAIVGIAHLMMQTELTPRQQEYLLKLNSASGALMRIINDILDFSKIEAGRLEMECISFDLEEVFETLSHFFAERIQSKGLELLVRIPPEIPRQLLGDPLRLGQVLTNLTANAVKFTHAGEILVSVEEESRKDEEICLRFSVKDTGIGISREEQASLFQAFSQGDVSTTRKYGGTGLGLAISSRLVTMMGGEIGVSSVVGEGSTFSFTALFPLALAAPSQILRPHPDLVNLRVLVIDDNATSREILQGMLEAMSFHVTPAASGAEGLEELTNASKESPFDLVVVDWRMPHMDGFATIRKIRSAHPPVSNVKIIMVTAYGREEILQRAVEADLEGFLIKPINQSTLFDTIMAAFGKEGASQRAPGFVKSSGNAMLKGIRGARILLVEDNEINQQIAEEILRQAGFVVALAHHGGEAVTMAGTERYDLILMDIQMPVMDGFAATEEIRNLPGESGKVPIVAMTAHTMKGDREKSLEAGMNDHIGKPIDPESLFAALVRWIEPREGTLPTEDGTEFPPPLSEKVPPLPSLPGVVSAAGLARLGGNRELYEQLLIKFRRDFGAAGEELAHLLHQGDLEGAERLVHTLQGVAGNIGANSVRKAAEALEEALKNGKDLSWGHLVTDLAQELHAVLEGLKDFQLKEEAPSSELLPPGDLTFLREKLLQMRSPLEERKPKQPKEILAEIDAYSWPQEYAVELLSLKNFLGGYKFGEAEEVLEALVAKLEK